MSIQYQSQRRLMGENAKANSDSQMLWPNSAWLRRPERFRVGFPTPQGPLIAIILIGDSTPCNYANGELGLLSTTGKAPLAALGEFAMQRQCSVVDFQELRRSTWRHAGFWGIGL